MSNTSRVVHKRRATITALPLYYSGHLLKKLGKERDFKKYFCELRGDILFLYKDDSQDTYIEKVELEGLKSMELSCPYQKMKPTVFTLKLPTQEVQLQMNNADTGEVWRGYILTVAKKEIPSMLQLLPGQMLQLKETLAQEKSRNPSTSRPLLPPRPSFLTSPSSSYSSSAAKDNPDKGTPSLPECFYDVTRNEAEKMLTENPEYGGIILRPSTLAASYALTLRQVTPSGPVMRNYKVTSTASGYVIELEKAVTVSTLNDVVKYFLKETEYRLHPYMASQPYDTRIEVLPVPKSISITSPTSKMVPQAQVAPLPRSKTKELIPLPTKPEDGEYVCPDDHKLTEDDVKQVKLDSELRERLKLRRENIYSVRGEEEISTYVNSASKKQQCYTVEWQTKGAGE